MSILGQELYHIVINEQCKGVTGMYGFGCCGGGYGGGYGYGGGRGFALIVVLFILLIIVGAAWAY